MEDVLRTVVAAPVANLLIIAGLGFIAVGLIGPIQGKIDPGPAARVVAGTLGLVLLVAGFVTYFAPSAPAHNAIAAPAPTRRPGKRADPPSSSEGPESSGTRTSAPIASSEFHVAQLLVRADPVDYRGSCPVEVTLSGQVSGAGSGGTVSYRFLRSDGASGPVQTLRFDRPGSQDVRTAFRILGGTFSGWGAVQILEPQAGTSNRAAFTIRCDSAAGPESSGGPTPAPAAGPHPPGPSTPPPVAGPHPLGAPTAAPAAPSGLHVAQLLVRVDPFDYRGPCPVQVTFSGRVSIVGSGGTVSYRFLRSDGALGPVQTLRFAGPGSQDVRMVFPIRGGPGFTFSGWGAIQIVAPEVVTSNRTAFTLRCEFSAGPRLLGAPTAAPAAPSGLHIAQLLVRVDPFDYRGPCPVQVTFSGRVSIVGSGGTVSYRFLRSDGASGPVQTLRFAGPGSQDVRMVFPIRGGPGFTFSGWGAIQIVAPEAVTSNRTAFTLRCR